MHLRMMYMLLALSMTFICGAGPMTQEHPGKSPGPIVPRDTVVSHSGADSMVVPAVVADTLPYRIPFSSSLLVPYDSLPTTPVRTPEPDRHVAIAPRTDLFGRDFVRNGSISRGFQIGSNRDATVVSGFRLQFAGPLTNDVSVEAALTDENSPVQPEGTTQSLREVDKVAIDLKGQFFGVTLGDFFFDRPPDVQGEFGQVTRKVQGIRGSVHGSLPGFDGIRASVSAVGASSRAQYHTVLLAGLEGVQGPYRLSGKNNELYIVVIAGSERVSINGEKLTRGETNDYVIDYATGEITFTTRRMITSDSRIYVDFEYADRDYARNIIGAETHVSAPSGAFLAGFSLLQEADDPDNPVGGPLDASVVDLLRVSGSDRWKASRSGVVYVGADSLTGAGRGQYASRDTLVMGRMRSILVYAPGEIDALYTVTFQRVDIVPADSVGYRRIRGGEYVFAGLGQGTHVPRVFITAPKLQRTMRGNVAARLGAGLQLVAEGSRSTLDRNRLSGMDDASDGGDAYALALSFRPEELNVFGLPLGRIDASLDQRFIDARFVSFGRVDPVEYARDWDIDQSRQESEWRRRFTVSYNPWSPLTISAFLGSLRRSDGSTSERSRTDLIVRDSGSFDIRGSAERVDRIDGRRRLRAGWERYASTLSGTFAAGRPSIDVRYEVRRERPDSSDMLVNGGFRFAEVTPGFETILSDRWKVSGSVGWRTEDSSLAGRLEPSFVATAAGMSASLTGHRQATFSADLSTRRTTFSEVFRARGNRDTRTTLIRTQAALRAYRNAIESRALYEFSSQQSSRLERVFIRVASGTGQYEYRGDMNGNGLADETEFAPVRFDGDYAQILVPGETLVPVNAVKASFRLRLRFRNAGMKGILSRLSTESYARVEEKSSKPSASSIALLHLSGFLDPASTIAGRQFLTNDLYLNESDPDFSLRFRVTESRGLTQLVQAPVRTYANERSVRVRGRLSNEVNSEIELFVNRDRSLGDPIPGRDRDLVLTGGRSDLLYRIDIFWELGLKLGLSRAENIGPNSPGTSDLNEQGVHITYGLPSRGSVRAELRREEITLAGRSGGNVPYEMTGGRVVGRTWLFEARADVRLTDIIQLNASYLGRIESDAAIVHSARVEARAVF